jgi:TolB protein
MRRLILIVPCLAMLALVAGGCGGESSAGAEAEIAFVSSRDGDYAIYGMRADGSGEGRLSDGEGGDASSPAETFFQVEPAWSPDGGEIAFASTRSGRSHVYVMRADGSGTRQLTSGKHKDNNPTWSPDGKVIAFQRDGTLFTMTSTGTGLKRVAKALGGDNEDPAWSPDGKWLAYIRRKPGWSTREVWRVRPDGTGSVQLTRLNVNCFTPAWSPDSKRIAFSSNANDDRYQLYEITTAGKGLRRLTFQPGEYFDPSWSPDGKTLVFERDGIVYSRNADGIEEALTDGPNDNSPAWRPVGPAAAASAP